MAIDKDKVLELFGRYWEIAYNEGRTGEGFPDLANDVLAELRDVLDADDGDVFTGQLVEIDGHVYGLRPGAARVVKEAMRDAKHLKWIAGQAHRKHDYDRTGNDAHWFIGFYADAACQTLRHAIDAAMAKDGAP